MFNKKLFFSVLFSFSALLFNNYIKAEEVLEKENAESFETLAPLALQPSPRLWLAGRANGINDIEDTGAENSADDFYDDLLSDNDFWDDIEEVEEINFDEINAEEKQADDAQPKKSWLPSKDELQLLYYFFKLKMGDLKDNVCTHVKRNKWLYIIPTTVLVATGSSAFVVCKYRKNSGDGNNGENKIFQ